MQQLGSNISKWLNNRNILPLLLLSAGFILRCIIIKTQEYGIYSDAREFKEIALNLVTGNGFSTDTYPTAYRMPGYPFFLALLYSLFHTDFAVKIIAAFVEITTGFLIYKFTKKTDGYTAGCIALAIWMFFPASVVQPVTCMSEGLFTLCFTALIVTMYRTEGSILQLLAAGLLCGLCALIKPHMLLFPAVLVCWLLFQKKSLRTIVLHTTIFTIVMVICIIPWVLRNQSVIGCATISTSSGQNLFVGNNPDASGSYYDLPAEILPKPGNEPENDRLLKKEAIHFIIHQPVAALKLLPRKIAFLFALEAPHAILLHHKGTIPESLSYTQAYRSTPPYLLLLFSIPYVFIILCTVWVFFFRLPTDTASRIVLLCMLFWIFIHCLYFGTPRFHYPLMPLLITVAVGIFHLPPHFRKQRTRIIGAIGVSGGFLTLWAAELFHVYLSAY